MVQEKPKESLTVNVIERKMHNPSETMAGFKTKVCIKDEVVEDLSANQTQPASHLSFAERESAYSSMINGFEMRGRNKSTVCAKR